MQNSSPWDFGFWHPFGPHGGECPSCIIKRKRGEIERTGGWTFWSFQYRKVIPTWQKMLGGTSRVVAFCSDSPGAANPLGAVRPMAEYQLPMGEWEAIPCTIEIPHPVGKKQYASAFKVRAIYEPPDLPPDGQPIEWFHTAEGEWRQSFVPTRGEFLLRPTQGTPLRKIAAVLELEAPYVVTLRGERAVQDNRMTMSSPAAGDGTTCIKCEKPLRLAKPRNSKTKAPGMTG